MSNWFLELSEGWDNEVACSELETLADSYPSLAAAWEGASDPLRLWLCARFADTHESRIWCLGTASMCATELLERSFGKDDEPRIAANCPEFDAFAAVLEPLCRGESVSNPRLEELVEAMAHYYDVARSLVVASHINERIAAALVKETARVRRSGREPDIGEVEARIATGVIAQRSKFASALLQAYRHAQASVSSWRMSRGQPLSRWGTDVVRSRHRCTADGQSIESIPLRVSRTLPH